MQRDVYVVLVAPYLSLWFVVEIFLIETPCGGGRWQFKGGFGDGIWVVVNVGGGMSVDGRTRVQA